MLTANRLLLTDELLPVLLNDLSHSNDDVAYVRLGHFGVNWQRDNAIKNCGCVRKVPRFVTELIAVVRMKVQRDEMDRSPDFFVSQRLNKFIAIDLEALKSQLDHKQMPRMLDIIPAGGNLNFSEISERFCVIHCDALSSFPKRIAFLQLFNPDGRRNIGQIVLESRIENLVVPRTFLCITLPSVMADPVEAHYPHPLGPF